MLTVFSRANAFIFRADDIYYLQDRRGGDLVSRTTKTTTNVTVRMDAQIKAQAEELFGALGMNLSTAINVFVRQSLRKGGFPFELVLDQPNWETREAMLEAEQILKDPSVKRYSDVEEALRELKK
ncbi:MAG: type II toxin-antitoxin system RelB/DinJ family antitoxin [Clostridia bacterium]|nr:type II toxin-antitoxin system RelB/DinJ family antitoxin [Clostridia bacterium]